ncbi:MAG: secretion protein HlyD, partial [Rhodobiaceae bacterium]|nr:secretion protein HlyD [Rhodobiaceae bacterium]
RPGAVARLINWGGPGTLDAVVRRIDPVGFTKVSSLGIEEQRVNTVLDLTGPEESYARLGHDFRVFVQIIVDNVANAVRVPLGALFRTGNDWAVFKVVDGKAVLTRLTLGERNDNFAEVASGLAEGDAVILHPSDSVEDGVAVEQRAAQ